MGVTIVQKIGVPSSNFSKHIFLNHMVFIGRVLMKLTISITDNKTSLRLELLVFEASTHI
jgi:hypothetical protein